MEDQRVNEYWCEIHQKEKWEQIDPFQLEVYEEEVVMLLCEDCYQDRADDI